MNTDDTTRLGMLDWGIGGMGLYRAWRRRRPEVPVLYWSDAGVAPYGTLDEVELRERVDSVCRELQRRGADAVAVACNTASTVVDDVAVDIPVDGIIEHAVDAACSAARARSGDAVGVLGGERTVRSGLYQEALRARGFSVEARVAQPISGLVERGVLSGPELQSELDAILDGLDEATIVLLACTHYPAVREAIAARLPGVYLVDPVDTWVGRLDEAWTDEGDDGEVENHFLTTGAPETMSSGAEAAFGVSPAPIESLEPPCPT